MKSKVGLIGYGSMGSMLTKGMIENKTVSENNFFLSTRSRKKIDRIKVQYPNINLSASNAEVAKNADILFVCVKPNEVKDILNEIKSNLKKDTHIISIAGGITIANIEKIITNGKISKVIPSLTSEVNEGISLVCHNKNVSECDKENLHLLLNAFSLVKIIEEKDFEIATDLTSCAPGLFAAIFNEYIEESLKHSTLSREESTEMVIKTLYGTAKFLKENNIGFAETLARVATKEGITEEGAKVLQHQLPKVFKAMFDATYNKHEIIKGRMNKIFDN
jgi:pyrroline-5-carboxylate reductase